MQFMLIMRDDDAAAIERRDGDVSAMMAAMGAYNDRLAHAGALVTAVGHWRGEGIALVEAVEDEEG